MVQDFFAGKEVLNTVNPDHVVACGAAVQAAVLNAAAIDRLQFNVTPLSIGVGGDAIGDFMFVAIPRNTSIPFRKVFVIKTTDDHQTTMSLSVYQGERFKAADNHFLGKLVLCGIPPAGRAEESIAVCFSMNNTGQLKVSAEHKQTGQKNEIIINSEDLNRLRKNETERMLIDAERFKLQDEQFKMNVATRQALVDHMVKMRQRVNKEKLKLEVIDKGVSDTAAWLDRNLRASIYELEQKFKELKTMCDSLP
ncbi:hypothetical protein KI387_041348 [Taxus chinensis]|uniref:Heat shock protein 70 n=1 Tax=Taxus chinensis TaxID=29808 RepID=A0AA38F9W3_TAXCH|nr:hypothetical protein KI387_041348 [Taxus chinensis]